MKFPSACTGCGHVSYFDWSQVGEKIACIECGLPQTVPAPMETIEEPASPPQRLKFRCPSCRRKFATKPEMAGQKIRCTGCGAGVRVPWAEEVSATPSSQPVLEVFALSDEITTAPASPQADTRRAGVARAEARSGPAGFARADIPRVDVRDPSARSESDDGPSVSAPELDALAGLDGSRRRRRPESVLSSRSEMIESVRQQAAEEDAVEAQKKVEKSPKKRKGKKKKKHSGYFDPKETLKLVAGVGALVAVLAFLAWGYPDFRVPLGGFLCLVGFIVYVMGAVSLRQLVAEEGIIKLLMFRFCPPYQWWFVATHWAEAKDFFAFFLAGAMVMSLGGAIIKISPLAQKADAAERAYQKKVERRQAELRPPMPSGIVEAEDD